ncbi:sulfotransferase 1B1-like [Mercenaria mercenaria]|uniref:sulfotransferase 1B1-like n=1 Tax=Mercenaria mercenaria TaxID=6596 RepID=UPI00234EE91D|nr:sulfotransferase 1B1-like [Mercenaria mercenaria]
MPLVTFKDAGGDTIRFMEVDGTRYPYISQIDQETAIRAAAGTKARDDDVLLITYLKSGTHWMWEVLSMLKNGKAETIPKVKQTSMIEAISEENCASIPSPRVLNAHFRFDQIPKDMKEKRTKVVLCHRNPKDVAVSLYHHHFKINAVYDYNGTWDNWFRLFCKGNVDYGSWFDYVLDWEKAIHENPEYPIHLMFFEDMKENSFREVKKLAKFLELHCTDELCHAIAEKCKFENMKKDKVGLDNEYWLGIWRDKKNGYYRKGTVGDWKNAFSVAQNELFDRLYETKMANSKLKFRFEL